MVKTVKVCIVNFSGRKNGNCHDTAKFVEQALTPEHEVNLFEMCNLKIAPCGKCDYECFYRDKKCPYADDDAFSVYHAVCAADLVYYIVPNYIEYPNAYFFTFNERKQGFFAPGTNINLIEAYINAAKKFIVVSNTEQDNFKQILNRHVAEGDDTNFLFMSTSHFDKGNARGGMMTSDRAKQQVGDFVKNAYKTGCAAQL